ncbi:hypothetical protein [Mycetocola sp. 2940]|uniref:hypothetical protein n=1 Tax=Mycetocola sp. 2940 TaxID=3156452 RepID=UPI00339589CA
MTRRHSDLPKGLGTEFSVADAAEKEVGRGRLRGADLERPFHGVRRVVQTDDPALDPFERRRQRTLSLARAYAERMRPTEFFSHETAALLWGAPLPLAGDGPLHVAVHGTAAVPRARGVVGHRTRAGVATLSSVGGLRVASPASTWAMLGNLELFDLVAVGDYFVRVWRPEGYFRVNPGMPPLTTPDRLRAAVEAGRRTGVARLRLALGLIREDSWSRAESITRCHLVTAGLPQPVLNRDYFDEFGEHLGCVDLSYPEYKVAIEYQGQHHGARHARDVERVERLRAAGWIVIQVTAPLLENPAELARRVCAALASRGWRR